MTFKKFIAVSLIVHALAVLSIYFIQFKGDANKAKEFVTSLVTPEELKKPEPEPVRPLPKAPIPPRRPAFRPPVPPRSAKRALPPPPVAKMQPVPIPEAPEKPGEGRGGGKQPFNENVSPGPKHEESGRRGDGGSEKPSPEPGFKPGYSGRGRELFDREITESIARKDVGKGNNGKKGEAPITFDTKVYEYSGYMSKLRQKIESIWVYPPEAVEKGIYGDLKIQFTILKNGRLGEVRLIRTSGYRMLDDAALKALKDGEPYWPLPAEWGRESYTVLGHFVYGFYGNQLR